MNLEIDTVSLATDPDDRAPAGPKGVLPLTLRVNETFEEFVHLNPELIVEQAASGEIVIMSPTGASSSDRNAEITFQLRAWSKGFGGVTFDSSVIFCLPDGSKRSPDASWIAADRWEKVSADDRKRFPSIAPDFVIELRSESDTLKELQAKMGYYIDNGVRLGWLVDPLKRQVHVYRPGNASQVLECPQSVSGEDVLPGFSLDLEPIWNSH